MKDQSNQAGAPSLLNACCPRRTRCIQLYFFQK